MASAQDSGLSGLRASSVQGAALYSWAGHFTLVVSLFNQVYKWMPTNLMPGVTLQWTRIPSKGDEILALCYRNWNTFQPDWPLGFHADLS